MRTGKVLVHPNDVEQVLLSMHMEPALAFDAAHSAGVYDALGSGHGYEFVLTTALRIAGTIEARTASRR